MSILTAAWVATCHVSLVAYTGTTVIDTREDKSSWVISSIIHTS